MKLMVRSFLGRFVRIGTQPRIDVHREVQERENASLYAGEGRQMIPPAAPFPNDRQGQSLKTFRQALGRGAGRRPLRVANIPPCQHRPRRGQPLADDKLQQSQDPQPDRQQSDQAGDMVSPLQVHRRQGQGVPFEPAHSALYEVLAAVGQHGLRQRELLGRGVGGIDPPAQPPDGGGHRLAIDDGLHPEGALHSHRRGSAAIAPQEALVQPFSIAHRQQPVHPVPGQERLDRCLQRGPLGVPPLPSPPGVEHGHHGRRLGQPRAQRRRSGAGQLARTHHQPPFGPGQRMAGHPPRQGLQSFVAGGNVLPCAGGGQARDTGQRLLSHGRGLHVTLQHGRRQLDLRQRAHVEIATSLNPCPGLQRHHLAIAHIQQPTPSYTLPDTRDGWQIQQIIGTLPWHDVRGYWQTQGIQHRQQALHLRQVGTMVLAVPNLQQPVFCHGPVLAGRGTVQPHALGLQVVRAQQVLGEGTCKGLPLFVMTQCLHHCRQPVVAEVKWVNASPCTGAQGVQALFGPGFHVVQPMIRLGEDMGQPEECDPTQTQPHLVAVGGEVFVQQGLPAHAVELGQQQGNVIDACTANGQGLGHGALPLRPRPYHNF
jgi:hypothetical protein